MPEDWCDHCDMLRSTCIHGNPPAKSDAPFKTGPTIEATQASPCGHCSRRLEPGQSITMSDEGWVHTEHLHHRSWPGDVAIASGPPPTDTSMFEGID